MSCNDICNSQITKVAPITPIEKRQEAGIQEFDSTTNYLGKNIKQYIGQTLYLAENNYIKNECTGYLLFLKYMPLNYDNDLFESKEQVYKPVKMKQSSLRKVGILYASDYDSMKDKYYKVINVLEGPQTEEKLNENFYYLQLVCLNNNDTLYYRYNILDKYWANSFIMVGYFEKLKQTYIGKSYEFFDPYIEKALKNSSYSSLDTTKYSTEKNTEQNGTIWKCIDVSIEDGNNYNLIAVLFNDKLGIKHVNVEEILSNNYTKSRFWDCKLKQATINAFGKEIFDSIQKRSVSIGMPRLACLLAWGEPKDMTRSYNKEALTEKWTYDNGKMLFFKDSKLEKVEQKKSKE